MQPTRRVFPPAPQAPATLLLTAHPSADSFLHALSLAWRQGATSVGMPVEQLDVNEMRFDPIRRAGYEEEPELEPDLLKVQQAIARACHVVVAFPLWWGSTPAVLKGLFDRAFLPGWAFAYEPSASLPKPGLTGRSARVIVTMDAPGWIDALMNRASGKRQVANATLKFCGMRPVVTSTFGQIGKSTLGQREQMLRRAHSLGEQDALRSMKRFGVRPHQSLSDSVAAKQCAQ